MMKWTGLAPWEFEFHFVGSLTSTFGHNTPSFSTRDTLVALGEMKPRTFTSSHPCPRAWMGASRQGKHAGAAEHKGACIRSASLAGAESVFVPRAHAGAAQHTRGNTSHLGGIGRDEAAHLHPQRLPSSRKRPEAYRGTSLINWPLLRPYRRAQWKSYGGGPAPNKISATLVALGEMTSRTLTSTFGRRRSSP